MTRRMASMILSLAAVLAPVATPAIAGAEEGGNPIVLPEPTAKAPLRFTSSTIGKTHIEIAGIALECESGTSSGEFTSKRLGVINVAFKNCVTAAKTKCHSEGDESGVILIPNADLHLVAFKSVKGELLMGVVITLAKSVSVNCETGSFTWEGSVFGSLDGAKTSEKTKTLKLLFHQKEGKQELKECELDNEFCFEGVTHRKFLLLQNLGGGKFAEIGIEREDTVTLEKEAAFDF